MEKNNQTKKTKTNNQANTSFALKIIWALSKTARSFFQLQMQQARMQTKVSFFQIFKVAM